MGSVKLKKDRASSKQKAREMTNLAALAGQESMVWKRAFIEAAMLLEANFRVLKGEIAEGNIKPSEELTELLELTEKSLASLSGKEGE